MVEHSHWVESGLGSGHQGLRSRGGSGESLTRADTSSRNTALPRCRDLVQIGIFRENPGEVKVMLRDHKGDHNLMKSHVDLLAPT